MIYDTLYLTPPCRMKLYLGEHFTGHVLMIQVRCGLRAGLSPPMPLSLCPRPPCVSESLIPKVLEPLPKRSHEAPKKDTSHLRNFHPTVVCPKLSRHEAASEMSSSSPLKGKCLSCFRTTRSAERRSALSFLLTEPVGCLFWGITCFVPRVRSVLSSREAE